MKINISWYISLTSHVCSNSQKDEIWLLISIKANNRSNELECDKLSSKVCIILSIIHFGVWIHGN